MNADRLGGGQEGAGCGSHTNKLASEEGGTGRA